MDYYQLSEIPVDVDHTKVNEINLLRKYKRPIKETKLSRKLKLKKKVTSLHSRGRQICAHFGLQHNLDTLYTHVGEMFYR